MLTTHPVSPNSHLDGTTNRRNRAAIRAFATQNQVSPIFPPAALLTVAHSRTASRSIQYGDEACQRMDCLEKNRPTVPPSNAWNPRPAYVIDPLVPRPAREPRRMPVKPATADQTLNFPGQAPFAWAEFDPAWYLLAYPAAREDDLTDPTAQVVLRYYLDTGQGLGQSPNRWFDEASYRVAYPDVAAAIGRGPASGFDHYCRGAFRTHAPHWLFDERLYRQCHPDLTDEALDGAQMANGYDHYLRHGAREQRAGHRFFDAALYLAQLDPAAAQKAAEVGPFLYYLRSIEAGRHEQRTSVYFDTDWYLQTYPEVAAAIGNGDWRCALHHYLANDTPAAFDPLPEFSEAYYLARYPDIAAAVEKGTLRSGYRHFLAFGAAELRSPNGTIDLRYYAGHPEVRAALRTDTATDPFTHYLATGRAQGLAAVPPPEERVTEGQAKTLFRRKADNLLPLFGCQPLDFTCAGAPAVSAIVVAHDRFALTLMALGSLRSNFPGDIELILVDSGSTDETRFIERYVRGVKLLQLDANIGFLRGCNAALAFATADAVLLLNNDVELAHGAIAAALARLRSDPAIGAVGGKVIRTHGLLQEAGCLVWRDGTTGGYLRDSSPLAPEANFVRDVDFCSGVFLLLRRTVMEKLQGFDEAFAPAYYEDVDLCFRISAFGGRVVYDPSVVVHHLEYGSARNALESEAAIGRNRLTFLRKYKALLETRPMEDRKALAFVRSAGPQRMRILFIEDMVPLRLIGSGFVRSNDIVQVMASLGHQVTVFPIYTSDADAAAIYSDMPDTVEVMYDKALADLPSFLGARPDYYTIIWIARTHNLDRLREPLERVFASQRRPRLILDTEAIASDRMAVKATLPGHNTPFDRTDALQQEFANASICDQVVAVTQQEAAILRELGLPRVAVVGHVRELAPTPRTFAARAGLLFIGAIHDVDSPNYDALCWFIDAVLPVVEKSLGWETRLTVVGYTSKRVSLDRFREHPRVTLRGMVADTKPLYDGHRLFIAPVRYAAGTPYKVHEAASFGLPIVTTDLLRRQTGWEAGTDLLAADSADPERFAELVVTLYRDADLWQRLRENALGRLGTENSREAYTATISDVLAMGR